MRLLTVVRGLEPKSNLLEKIIKKTTQKHPTAGAPIFADQVYDHTTYGFTDHRLLQKSSNSACWTNFVTGTFLGQDTSSTCKLWVYNLVNEAKSLHKSICPCVQNPLNRYKDLRF